MGIKVLCRKEGLELVRTNKIFILPLLYLAFGFFSPLITKMMPDILAGMGQDIQIILPELTWVDSFSQLFKNYNQIMFLALILLFMGSVAEEKNKGTAILVLTKPVSRTYFVLAKGLMALIVVVLSVLLSYGACLLYTTILFPGVEIIPTVEAMLLYIASAIFLLGVIIGSSALVSNQVLAGGLTLGIYSLAYIVSMLSAGVRKYGPASLSSYQDSILQGQTTLQEAAPAALVAIFLGIAIFFLGIYKFKTQEL